MLIFHSFPLSGLPASYLPDVKQVVSQHQPPSTTLMTKTSDLIRCQFHVSFPPSRRPPALKLKSPVWLHGIQHLAKFNLTLRLLILPADQPAKKRHKAAIFSAIAVLFYSPPPPSTRFDRSNQKLICVIQVDWPGIITKCVRCISWLRLLLWLYY